MKLQASIRLRPAADGNPRQHVSVVQAPQLVIFCDDSPSKFTHHGIKYACQLYRDGIKLISWMGETRLREVTYSHFTQRQGLNPDPSYTQDQCIPQLAVAISSQGLWVFSLGKAQIIYSWKHSLLSSKFSFRLLERQADPLGTGLCITFQALSSWTSSTGPPAPCSVSSQLWTKPLSGSGHPDGALLLPQDLPWVEVSLWLQKCPWHRCMDALAWCMSLTQSLHKHSYLFTSSAEWKGKYVWMLKNLFDPACHWLWLHKSWKSQAAKYRKPPSNGPLDVPRHSMLTLMCQISIFYLRVTLYMA